jgi:hypothetical protein
MKKIFLIQLITILFVKQSKQPYLRAHPQKNTSDMQNLQFSFLVFTFFTCTTRSSSPDKLIVPVSARSFEHTEPALPFDSTTKTIHIFVALCDNKFQGIVPVPAKIGNGRDPKNNLYWGCGYGVKTYFEKSSEWKLLEVRAIDSIRLERLVFMHTGTNWYLVADAYDGQYIRQCTKDFLSSTCGDIKDSLHVNNTVIGISGNAKLLGYVGHDGLMDFDLAEKYENTDGKRRDVMILACSSRRFFTPYLKSANINPLLWTTGLMAPEAYTLHDAISGYLKNEPGEGIRTRAAQAYSKYQRCSEKAARNLLVTGW